LASPAVARIALGNPAYVPAGRYARAALQAAGLWPAVEPRLVLGESVRQVLDYAARGEVDAAFVFATDPPTARGRVRVVAEVPLADPPHCPVAVTARAPNPGAARAFVALATGPRGRAVLERHGFRAP
ncbi:MAG: molybdate ABC transporter substrate-binding protein, partial [Deferrisomatales bacterium]